MEFLCNLVSSALCIWTSTVAVPLLAINNSYFSTEQITSKGSSLLQPGLNVLASCIENVQESPWDQLSANVSSVVNSNK